MHTETFSLWLFPEGTRREEIRRQHIESEQRRCDELWDGYRRLKDALPVPNQKSSKTFSLDRASRRRRRPADICTICARLLSNVVLAAKARCVHRDAQANAETDLLCV